MTDTRICKLQEGEYFIPDGCTVKRVGNTIHVYKMKQRGLAADDYRCKDCVHYVEGYSSQSGWFKTKVCDMQLKSKRKDGRMVYRAALKYGKPCGDFENRLNFDKTDLHK